MNPNEGSQPVARFQISLLGPFVVLRDSVLLPTQHWQRWVGALLKLLATAPSRRRPKDELVELLWPTATPSAGASNLRYVLHLLRRNLGSGEPGPLLSQRGWIELNPAYDWELDLDTFRSLLWSAGTDRTCLEAAAALYRGEPSTLR